VAGWMIEVSVHCEPVRYAEGRPNPSFLAAIGGSFSLRAHPEHHVFGCCPLQPVMAKRSEIDMQRLVFEPISGSWILETLENNETVIMDFAELTPEGVAMRFDLDEVKRSMAGALADLESIGAAP